jgi:UDP-glucose 4-epimerase
MLEADLSDPMQCAEAMQAAADIGPIAEVWHLAANADISGGFADPYVDLRDTFLTTFEILRQMRRLGAPSLVFASSSAIYGDLGARILDEDTGPLLPISLYGAMKLGGEGQISAACEAFLHRALVLRFPNVTGTPATHGVVVDFVRRLRDEPGRLTVLGDGSQRKPYLHVTDLIDAMMVVRSAPRPGMSVLNVGPEDQGVTVRSIAEQVVARVSPGAEIIFGEQNRGWVGDVPRFRYSNARIRALGWSPSLSSAQAMSRAIDEIARQEGF